MAALGMPRRGKVNLGECRQRAVHVGRGEIVWQDRCDAANGSKEPKVTSSRTYKAGSYFSAMNTPAKIAHRILEGIFDVCCYDES